MVGDAVTHLRTGLDGGLETIGIVHSAETVVRSNHPTMRTIVEPYEYRHPARTPTRGRTTACRYHV